MKVTRIISSPVGDLIAIRDGDDLIALEFPGRAPPHADARRDDDALADVKDQLDAYFAGERRAFDLRLRPSGTDFQRAVWAALVAIPYGATTTYSAIARAVGRPDAVRAVGAANGANPIAIIVPCHRVVGANGTLTGYGGGLPRKQYLLELEARTAGAQLRLPGVSGA